MRLLLSPKLHPGIHLHYVFHLSSASCQMNPDSNWSLQALFLYTLIYSLGLNFMTLHSISLLHAGKSFHFPGPRQVNLCFLQTKRHHPDSTAPNANKATKEVKLYEDFLPLAQAHPRLFPNSQLLLLILRSLNWPLLETCNLLLGDGP